MYEKKKNLRSASELLPEKPVKATKEFRTNRSKKLIKRNQHLSKHSSRETRKQTGGTLK